MGAIPGYKTQHLDCCAECSHAEWNYGEGWRCAEPALLKKYEEVMEKAFRIREKYTRRIPPPGKHYSKERNAYMKRMEGFIIGLIPEEDKCYYSEYALYVHERGICDKYKS